MTTLKNVMIILVILLTSCNKIVTPEQGIEQLKENGLKQNINYENCPVCPTFGGVGIKIDEILYFRTDHKEDNEGFDCCTNMSILNERLELVDNQSYNMVGFYSAAFTSKYLCTLVNKTVIFHGFSNGKEINRAINLSCDLSNTFIIHYDWINTSYATN